MFDMLLSISFSREFSKYQYTLNLKYIHLSCQHLQNWRNKMLQCDMGYLTNTQSVVEQALGNQHTFFALIIRPLYYSQSEAMIWVLAVGQGGVSCFLSFWMVLDTLVAARDWEEIVGGHMSTSDSQLKDYTVWKQTGRTVISNTWFICQVQDGQVGTH